MTDNPQHRLSESVSGDRVCAVIVTYFPELVRLGALLESVRSQAGHVVVVDNGSSRETLTGIRQLIDGTSVKLIEFGENRGIAAAHNAGIRFAMDGATDFAIEYVLLLDHDSRLLPGCVQQLLQASRRLADSGVKIGAVGPQYNDETSGQRAPFWQFHRWSYRRIHAHPDDDVIETSVLISSGTLISCATLKAIGLMDESLFIDGVDWEWCFRASALGYRLFGVTAAVMQHSLGDSGIKVLGRVLPLHGPLRHYYVYRNCVLMCGMANVPMSWKFYFSLRLVVRFFIYMVLAQQRGGRCRMIWRGICDGMSGRRGRIGAEVLPSKQSSQTP